MRGALIPAALVAMSASATAPAAVKALRLADMALLVAADRDVMGAATPVSATLRWAEPVTLALEPGSSELVLHYDRRIDDAAMKAFVAAAGDRIGTLDWGYDTLVLRPARGWSLDARQSRGGVDVRFAPVTDPAAEGAPTATTGDVDRRLIAAQADFAAGYPGRAHRQLSALAQQEPGNRAVGAALAESELATGRAAAGARRFRALRDSATMPDPLLDRAAERAGRAAGPTADLDVIIRSSADFDQRDIALRLALPVTDAHAVEFGVRQVGTRSSQLVTADGVLFHTSADRLVLTLGGRSQIGSTVRLRYALSALDGLDLVGFSVGATMGEPERMGTVRIVYHEPDLLTSEGAYLGGWIDRVSIGGSVRPLPGLTLRAQGGLNRYGLRHEDGRAGTAALEGGVEYIVRRQSPLLAINYRMEGEYVLDRDLRPSGFAYIPVGDRENHTVEALVSQPVLGRAGLTAAAGWTVDRFAGNGPTASVGINAWPGGPWELSMLGGISSITRPGLQSSELGYVRLLLVHRPGGQGSGGRGPGGQGPGGRAR